VSPLVWALSFIVVLLAFGWLMDRRTKRRRRGLLAGGTGPAGYLDATRLAPAQHAEPDIGVRGDWRHGSHGPGG
jgi:multisubunit Na+/H+ antiporter MnhB subunit